jgi:hypothetical protein
MTVQINHKKTLLQLLNFRLIFNIEIQISGKIPPPPPPPPPSPNFNASLRRCMRVKEKEVIHFLF